MLNQFATTVIVSDPGPRRQCLSSLLRVVPEIDHVYIADNDQEALQLIEAKKNCTTLVVFDGHFMNGNLAGAIKCIKEKIPLVHILLLAEQSKADNLPNLCGADAVLLEYFSIGEFQEAVNGFLLYEDAPPDRV